MAQDLTGVIAQFWNLLTHLDAAQAKALASSHLGLTLAVCFVSGILASLTPCVYPVIPITINIFARAAHQSGKIRSKGFHRQSFMMAVVYVAGMSFTYSILGLISGLTGSLFGSLLQSTWVLGLLTLLFFILSLGQLGFFKMTLPSSWHATLMKMGNSESKFGIFIMGVVSGLIVSPCVGPLVAGILAFVFESSNALLGSLYFFVFSLGLGVLFLFIGGFSSSLASLPRSGVWMVGVNYLLSFLLLGVTFYYGSLWIKKFTVNSVAPNHSGSLIWSSSEETGLALSKERNLPLLIDFTAEWCESCHELEKYVFSDPKVEAVISSSFIPVRIDVTSATSENELLLSKYGVIGLPAIVFATPDGTPLSTPRVNGLVTADQFIETLRSVSKDF